MDASGVFLAKKSLKTLHSCQKKSLHKKFLPSNSRATKFSGKLKSLEIEP